jgi:hypothetical protein
MQESKSNRKVALAVVLVLVVMLHSRPRALKRQKTRPERNCWRRQRYQRYIFCFCCAAVVLLFLLPLLVAAPVVVTSLLS